MRAFARALGSLRVCAVACRVVHEVHVVTCKTYTPQPRVRRVFLRNPPTPPGGRTELEAFALAFAFGALVRDACRTSNQREKVCALLPAPWAHLECVQSHVTRVSMQERTHFAHGQEFATQFPDKLMAHKCCHKCAPFLFGCAPCIRGLSPLSQTKLVHCKPLHLAEPRFSLTGFVAALRAEASPMAASWRRVNDKQEVCRSRSPGIDRQPR